MTIEECENTLTKMQLESLDPMKWFKFLEKYKIDDLITMLTIVSLAFPQTASGTKENYSIGCQLAVIGAVIGKKNCVDIDLEYEEELHGNII